jgi:hypothetical protein
MCFSAIIVLKWKTWRETLYWKKQYEQNGKKLCKKPTVGLGFSTTHFLFYPIFYCLWEKDKWPRFRIFQSLLRYKKESSVEIIEEQPHDKMIKDFYSRRIFKTQYKMYDRYQPVKSCTCWYVWLSSLNSDHICSLGNAKSRLEDPDLVLIGCSTVFTNYHKAPELSPHANEYPS